MQYFLGAHLGLAKGAILQNRSNLVDQVHLDDFENNKNVPQMSWPLILEDALCNVGIAPSPPAQQPFEPYLALGYGFSLPQAEYAFYPLANDTKGTHPQVIEAT